MREGRGYARERFCATWHLATLKVDGKPMSACIMWGFNKEMLAPEFVRELPEGANLCGHCEKVGDHIVNVGGAVERHPVSSMRLGTGARRY